MNSSMVAIHTALSCLHLAEGMSVIICGVIWLCHEENQLLER